MSNPIKVNNVFLGSSLPVIVATTGTPTQVYRNTDNTMFIPTLIVATNITATGAHRFILVDADLTDSGEDSYKDEAYDVLDVNIAASETIILNEDDMPGIKFRYGVAGYVSNSAIDVTMYIEGYEIAMTSTE